MTSRKHLKRLVRRRAALTGESYATALRTVRRTRQEDAMPAPTTPDPAPPDVVAYCSFCGKPNTEVRRLVAGPGVLICDECVDLSVGIIASSPAGTPEETALRRRQYVERPSGEILALLPALARSLARLEGDVSRWVDRLLAQGTEWPVIAEALGMDTQEARRRFGRPE